MFAKQQIVFTLQPLDLVPRWIPIGDGLTKGFRVKDRALDFKLWTSKLGTLAVNQNPILFLHQSVI